MQALHSGKMALLAQQLRLDTIANNIANVNTSGFKARTVNFKDMLYTTMQSPVASGRGNLLCGTGVLVSSVDYSLAQGVPVQTASLLDCAIDGEGFFTVRNTYGQTLYTRDGSFALSNEDDGRYLVTARGAYVLDTQGNRIAIPEGPLSDLSMGQDGTLAYNRQPIAQLNIVTFANPYGLSMTGNNCFAVTDASGGPVASGAVVIQGFLENSNVDVAAEMTTMIRTQRAFSFAGRAISTADEMDALVNNMRT